MKQGKRKMKIGSTTFVCVVFIWASIATVTHANRAQIKVSSKLVVMSADFNRDGVIEFSHVLTKNSVRTDLNTEEKPFVFWVNDDDDKPDSESSGHDVPNSFTKNGLFVGTYDYDNNHIDGSRDLIDFFPVAIDLHQYLTTTDISKNKFYLQQDDAAVNIVYTQMNRGITTDLSKAKASDYLKRIDNSDVKPIFGSWQTDGPLKSVKIHTVKKAGIEIPKEFIQSIIDDENKGVILVEGKSETTKPLKLVIRDENNNLIVDAELPIRIYGVEKLFRQVSLRGDGRDEDSTKWGVNRVGATGPDVATLLEGLTTQSTNIQSIVPAEININNHVIFIHGFKVTSNEARGTQSEVYKRLYHSGSNALLTGVHWNGDEGTPVATKYWYNVENAFYTADDFSALINGIKGAGVKKTIIAHSLGNMVAGLAIQDFELAFDNYFMLNPAVATEAYQSITNAKKMRHPDWDDYYFGDNYQEGIEAENYNGVRADGKNGRLLWSTEWYRFFTDDRKALTWRNRLSTVGGSTKVVQYYSSGEEVLREATKGAPNPFDAFPTLSFINNSTVGTNAWNIQEKSKGIVNAFTLLALNYSSGWGFNSNCYIPAPSDVTVSCNDLLHDQAETYFFNAPADQLITQPFFERFDEAGLMELSFNQEVFENSYPHVMAFEIPALSHAAGGTVSSIFELKGNAFDMNKDRFDDWPADRGGLNGKEWFHSDFNDVSYRYVYPLYDDFVTRGSL